MKEETALSNKYFKKTMSFKTQQTVLFFIEEMIVVAFLAAMVYLVIS